MFHIRLLPAVSLCSWRSSRFLFVFFCLFIRTFHDVLSGSGAGWKKCSRNVLIEGKTETIQTESFQPFPVKTLISSDILIIHLKPPRRNILLIEWGWMEVLMKKKVQPLWLKCCPSHAQLFSFFNPNYDFPIFFSEPILSSPTLLSWNGICGQLNHQKFSSTGGQLEAAAEPLSMGRGGRKESYPAVWGGRGGVSFLCLSHPIMYISIRNAHPSGL